MMAAVQPFLSGAISKTVNMPTEATPEEIEAIYVEAWKLGLKSIAVYRDGCKRSQPLNTSIDKQEETPAAPATRAVRRRLPDERRAVTHKFSIGGHDGYITVGMYEDGSPGEVFIVMAKEGSIVSGLMDSFATAVSLALQYGVPLEVLVRKFVHSRFEPAGMTSNPQIPMAKSIMDYIFRWLALKFLPEVADEVNSAHRTEGAVGGPMQVPNVASTDAAAALPIVGRKRGANGNTPASVSNDFRRQEQQVFRAQADAPPCSECGEIMVRNGACYKCLNCGVTSGCS
jgi:ribonucleoside-diphosphate reductase alpha chain